MNIKKEILIGIIGTLLIIGALIYFITQYGQNQQQPAAPQSPSPSSLPTKTNESTDTDSSLTLLTTEEVAKHNTETDYWIIINNSVYEVTDYLSFHPGGADKIISACGTDATQGFNTKGGKGPHSPKAHEQLEDFKIGDVNE